jgi:hypothetical protein
MEDSSKDSMSVELISRRRGYESQSSCSLSLALNKLRLINSRKDRGYMTKTIDVITEIIRNPKHPFRKADDRPVKAQKHRYERRKIREYIRLGDWVQENPA